MTDEQVNQAANKVINALPNDSAWALTIMAIAFAKIATATNITEKAALDVTRKALLLVRDGGNSRIIRPYQ